MKKYQKPAIDETNVKGRQSLLTGSQYTGELGSRKRRKNDTFDDEDYDYDETEEQTTWDEVNTSYIPWQ